jgi:hypothetical protein
LALSNLEQRDTSKIFLLSHCYITKNNSLARLDKGYLKSIRYLNLNFSVSSSHLHSSFITIEKSGIFFGNTLIKGAIYSKPQMNANKLLKRDVSEKINFSETSFSYTQPEPVILTRSQLYIDKWTPLPEWGTFFIEMGRRVAECETGSNRLVVALAIPTRAYAAALTAFGVVVTRATLSKHQLEDTNEYFEQLCNLRQGTPVTFLNKGRKFKAFYEGVDLISGKRRLRIRVESCHTGGLTHLVPLEESHNIEIRDTPIVNLPKKQNGRKIAAHSKFLEDVVGDDIASTYAEKSQLDCVIIGKESFLRTETTKIDFAGTPSFKKAGVLQDILRVKKFFLTYNQAYRSQVFSATPIEPPHPPNGKVPFVSIFDGASSFVKWRDDWRTSHWIILLDRTEIHFQEAVDIVNQDYINRVDEEIPNLPSHPRGVEVVVYQEAR